MLTLWGNADSVNVQKVAWCCEELALPFRRMAAGRHFGGLDAPAFRAMNPNGLVPTIREDDDGFVLWESNAIVRYLAAKHAPGSLWPEDPRARADADRWMDWANSTLWPTLLPLFRAFMRMPEDKRDAAAIALQTAEAADVMRVLDEHLATRAFLGGEAFTMADIAVGSPAWRWFALPLGRVPLPHLQRWQDALAARPAYRRTVMLPLTR